MVPRKGWKMIKLKWVKVEGTDGNEYHAHGANRYEIYPSFREFYLLVETPDGKRESTFCGPLEHSQAAAQEIEKKAIEAALIAYVDNRSSIV